MDLFGITTSPEPEICAAEPAPGAPIAASPEAAAEPQFTMSPPKSAAWKLGLGLFGTSAAVVAFDRYVVQGLVDLKFIPKEAHLPVTFGAILGAVEVFRKIGLTETGAIASLRSLPMLMGLQTVVNAVLFDGLEMEPDFVGQTISLTAASAPLFLAHRSASLSAALAGGGESLSLGLGASFAKLLGWASIIDLGAGAGLWALGRWEASGTGEAYDDNVRLWETIRLAQFLFNQERYGSTVAATFGNVFSAMDGLHVLIGDEYGAYGQRRIAEIQEELAEGSDEFGRAMNEILLTIVGRHLNPAAPSIDWAGVQKDLSAFYGREDNAQDIKTGYDFVSDYTAPLTQSGVADLVEIVDRAGKILDQERFRAYVHFQIALKRERELPELTREAEYLGLMEFVERTVDADGWCGPRDVEVLAIPADPTPEQKDLLLKIADWNTLEAASRPK